MDERGKRAVNHHPEPIGLAPCQPWSMRRYASIGTMRIRPSEEAAKGVG